MSRKINITEVGLRDGLQSLDQIIKTEDKLFLIKALINSGVKRVQVASFVHQGLVPQMADAEKLIRLLPKNTNVEFSGFLLNIRGLERAIDSGIKKVETSISTSNTHSKKNTRMSLKQAKKSIAEIINKAKNEKIKIRAGLQCVWGCAYEGLPSQNHVLSMVSYLKEIGADVISLSDSTGMATPDSIKNQLEIIFNKFPNISISLHLHNTNNLGLLNLKAGLMFGINEIDSSLSGVGGSPFIKGSTGNISTEETVNMLETLGYSTGINLKKISQTGLWLNKKIYQKTPS